MKPWLARLIRASFGGAGLLWMLAGAVIWTACSREFISPIGPGADDQPVLIGAGDIAVCGSAEALMTGRLLERQAGTVFAAGDLAYPSGTAAQFRDCYHPAWGGLISRTRPAPGNHEYESPGAAPYFEYFGANAGPPGLGYYSYRKGDWVIYSLNSNVAGLNQRAQLDWLTADLAANRRGCSAAYFHHPLVSSGIHGMSPPSSIVRDLWKALYAAGVDVVISAHEHFYERFAPLDPDGRLDLTYGIRQFIAGTGGAPLREPVRRLATSETAFSTHGVLRLTLEATSYRWEFISASEQNVLDSGSGLCHDRPR